MAPVTQRLVLAVLVAMVLAITLVFGVTTFLDRQEAPAILISDPYANATVVVAIDGAVAKPGTYGLPASARVQDAIVAAGGLTANADLAQFNPAQRIRDEDQIHIAAVPPTAAAAQAGIGIRSGPVPDAPAKLDINRATEAELEDLPGIGPAIATRIIEFRDEHGFFTSIEELAQIAGISPRTVDELREHITAEP